MQHSQHLHITDFYGYVKLPEQLETALWIMVYFHLHIHNINTSVDFYDFFFLSFSLTQLRLLQVFLPWSLEAKLITLFKIKETNIPNHKEHKHSEHENRCIEYKWLFNLLFFWVLDANYGKK